MESQFAGWLEQPMAISYTQLLTGCMACQNWQREHLCPICRMLEDRWYIEGTWKTDDTACHHFCWKDSLPNKKLENDCQQ